MEMAGLICSAISVALRFEFGIGLWSSGIRLVDSSAVSPEVYQGGDMPEYVVCPRYSLCIMIAEPSS